MALFLELYLGHLLGDFALQPGRLVVAKRESLGAQLLHTGIVGLSTAAVFFGTLRIEWPVVVLAAGAHFAIERATIALRLHTHTRGLFAFLLDQSLHIGSLVILAMAAGATMGAARAVAFGLLVTTMALAQTCAVVTAMLFGSILVFEATVSMLTPEAGHPILSLDAARVAGFLERGAAMWLAFLHPALVLVPFVPRTVLGALRHGDQRRRQLLAVVVGLGLCAALYALTVGIAAVVG